MEGMSFMIILVSKGVDALIMGDYGVILRLSLVSCCAFCFEGYEDLGKDKKNLAEWLQIPYPAWS